MFSVEKVGLDFLTSICSLLQSSFINKLKGSIYTSPKIINYMHELLSSDVNTFWGLFFNGNIVGFLHAKQMNGSIHLNNIMILEEYQGVGSGGLLMKAFLEQSIETRSFMTLDVDSRNIKAVAWYKKLGFQEINKTYVYFLPSKNPPSVSFYDIFEIENLDAFNDFGFGFGSMKDQSNSRVGLILPNIIRVENFECCKQSFNNLVFSLDGYDRYFFSNKNVTPPCEKLLSWQLLRLEKVNDF